MRVLAAGEATTSRAFTLAEFTGGEGPWTVPHLHRGMEESFFVLDGEFTFAVGEEKIPAGPGSYILVPRGTRHAISAGTGGGRFLTLMAPAAWRRCSSNSQTCRKTASPTQQCELRSPPDTTPSQPRHRSTAGRFRTGPPRPAAQPYALTQLIDLAPLSQPPGKPQLGHVVPGVGQRADDLDGLFRPGPVGQPAGQRPGVLVPGSGALAKLTDLVTSSSCPG